MDCVPERLNVVADELVAMQEVLEELIEGMRIVENTLHDIQSRADDANIGDEVMSAKSDTDDMIKIMAGMGATLCRVKDLVDIAGTRPSNI